MVSDFNVIGMQEWSFIDAQTFEESIELWGNYKGIIELCIKIFQARIFSIL